MSRLIVASIFVLLILSVSSWINWEFTVCSMLVFVGDRLIRFILGEVQK